MVLIVTRKKADRHERVLNALRLLWMTDVRHRKEIEDAAKQWTDWGSFDPKNLSMLVTRLAVRKIPHGPKDFKMTLKGNATQMDELDDRQLTKMIPYLRSNQVRSIMTRCL
jgi:hypothetical protein